MEPGSEVYRPAAPRVAGAASLLAAGWWLAGTLPDADLTTALRDAARLLAGALVVHVVLWRPAVVVDDAGALLRNPLRDVRVPWGSLEAVRTRYALTLVAGGRGYRSWAAAAPGRPGVLRGTWGPPPAGTGPGTPGAGAWRGEHVVADPRWTGGEGTSRPASSDLRGDAGAAAFLVERYWQRWRQGPTNRPAVPDEGEVPGGGDARVRWSRPALARLGAAVALIVLAALPG